MQHEQFQLHADIEERHWWFVGRRRILCRLVAEVLPPSPQAAIVDVGCGTGGNIAALADRYPCVGIDTSAEAIELARRRFPKVQFIAGRAPNDLGELAGRLGCFLLDRRAGTRRATTTPCSRNCWPRPVPAAISC